MKTKRLVTFLFAVFMTILGLAVFIILSDGFTKAATYLTILVGLFLIFGVMTFIQNWKNKVDKDELSQELLRRAASRSFVISFYPWVILMIFDRLFENSLTQIAVGIGAMGIIFLVNYIIVRLTGIQD